MVTISLCLIVKDEEDTLGNCLSSVKDITDEIIIVDTGSTDNTKKIASLYTDKVFDFQWIDDFASARNYAFSKATQEYIFWLDSDDILLEEDQQKLLHLKQTLNNQVDVVSMIYHYAFDEFGNVSLSLRRNRLVKRRNNFQWHGAVHEYLAVGGLIHNSSIVVTHKRIHSNSDRNLRIFEKRLEMGEAFSPRDLYYYANELMDHQQWEKAAIYYQNFLATKQGWIEDVIASSIQLAIIYTHLDDSKKARRYAYQSFNEDVPRAEICCQLGYHFLAEKKLSQAIFWYKLATTLEKPVECSGFLQDDCWTWLPHLQLTLCYYQVGNYKKSYHHNELARSFRPKDKRILYNKKLLEEVLNL